MSLGSKIQQIRKEHGLSQEQFADQFHVTRQTISNWENDRNYPDMTSLRQISETFGISFDTLLKDDEVYLQRVDDSVKKVPVLKRLLLALLGILLVVVLSFAVFCGDPAQCISGDGRRRAYQQRYPGEDDREPAGVVAFAGDHLYRGV